jgi:hypothetical protein
MWICIKNAFVSIVSKDVAPDELLVRARRPGDLERIFPGCKVIEKDGSDYQFRAAIKRDVIAAAIAKQIAGISYPNFKNAVKDDALHSAYASFWHQHARLQPRAPYSRRSAEPAKPAPKRRPRGQQGVLV